MVNSKTKLATLYSGIGSPEQAAERVWGKDGYEIVFACEIDKYARKSYQAIYDIDPKHFHSDIRQFDATGYKDEDIDLLVWGFPCQSYSMAGKRKGLNDEKTGDLFHEGLRVIKECKPKYSIAENVKGILSIDDGETIRLILRDIQEAGYRVTLDVLNTKEFGVPQNRERVFIVMERMDIPEDGRFYFDVRNRMCRELIHEIPHRMRYKFPQPFPLKKKLKDILEDRVDEKYYLSEKIVQGFISATKKHNDKNNGFEFKLAQINGISNAITTRAGSRLTDTYIKVKSATKCGYEIATDGDSINFSVPNSKTRRGRVGKQVAQTLDTQCNQGVIGMLDIKGNESIRRVYGTDGVAPTLTTMGGGNREPKICFMRGRNPDNPSDRRAGIYTEQRVEVNQNGTSNALTSVHKDNLVYEGFTIRRLTPLECWRLQDFPDEAFYKAQKVNSDTQLYRQAGNTISVNVMEQLFRKFDLKVNQKIDVLDDEPKVQLHLW